MEVSSGYKLPLGADAPAFKLPGVDGRTWSLDDLSDSSVLVVAFWCNHCPYVRAYEKRLVDFARAYAGKGVAVVAINSNDAENYPTDSFPHMVERAKEQGYGFPYLRDEDQSVATAYGGECTPHFLVFDAERRLAYQGRFDDNKDNAAAAQNHYVRDAVEDLLAKRPVTKAQTWAIGCSIKWTKA